MNPTSGGPDSIGSPALRHPGRWLWLLLLVPVIIGLVRLRFDFEIFDLLPSDIPAVGGLKLYQEHFANARELVVAIEGPTAERTEEVARGIAEAVACGTAVVGDISNTLVTFEPLTRSPLAGVVFYELIRFNAPEPSALVDAARAEIAALSQSERVRASLAAHAPYSVAPLLFRAIRQAVDHDAFTPCSVHLSESAEEVEFIQTGGGPWRAYSK